MSLRILILGQRGEENFFRQAAATHDDDLAIETSSDPSGALVWASHHQPDLVVVDLRRLELDGIQFTRQLRSLTVCADIPVIVITNSHDKLGRYRAMLTGANEVLSAPLDLYECKLRLMNLLTMSAQRRIIKQQAKWLSHGVTDITREIHSREKETLLRLARAGEYRDETTGSHILRIAKNSRHIAEALGLPKDECDIIEAAAPMHDIGKIGISDSLLRKKSALTLEERQAMESHTVIGYEILKESESVFLQRGAEIALAHHEKYDGSGYPYRLRGEKIPLSARIVAVADVYDALTSVRPYKQAWTEAKAVDHLVQQRGIHFDPDCVDAFVSQVGQAANF